MDVLALLQYPIVLGGGHPWVPVLMEGWVVLGLRLHWVPSHGAAVNHSSATFLLAQ